MLFIMFPNAKKSKLDLNAVVAKLNSVFYDVNNSAAMSSLERRAAFLAQLAHESASFTAISENLNYSAVGLMKTFKKYFPTQELADQYAKKPMAIANRVYAKRMGNGDEASGDGWKYRGRGFLQLTGKKNYTAAGLDLGVDMINDPDYATTPEGAVNTALWYWKKNNLNIYSDVENIREMTRIINGGYNGLDERIANYNKAKEILLTG